MITSGVNVQGQKLTSTHRNHRGFLVAQGLQIRTVRCHKFGTFCVVWCKVCSPFPDLDDILTGKNRAFHYQESSPMCSSISETSSPIVSPPPITTPKCQRSARCQIVRTFLVVGLTP